MSTKSAFRLSIFLALAAISLPSLLAQQRQGPPPITSPQVATTRAATFRIRAPQAKSVHLNAPGDIPQVPVRDGLEMTKGADDVWAVTIDDLAPGAYRYSFNVDGVTVADPNNPLTSQSNGNSWSLVYVPGASFMDEQSVPHGAVAEVFYASAVLGKNRRMHIYTPPGYEKDSRSYPVFYLLHGAGDSDDAWSTAGRAGFILDNLISSGQAKPMIVVMPDGHTSRRGAPGAADAAPFEEEFNRDIKPYVENHYRALTDRANTAIAGLSMGGGQTLNIAIPNLGDYAYFGVFSSGVFSINDSDEFEKANAAVLNDAKLREGLKLVWFSTGSDDFLIDTSKATVAMLRDHGFDVEFQESTGGHTWINWRNYLNKFAPRLFQ